MSAARDEREIAERIVGWLAGEHPRGTAGVEGAPPRCSFCGSRPFTSEPQDELIEQIEEIITEGLHS